MKKTILLFSILIIASFLRLYNLTELPPGLYPDEAMNGNNAQEALDTGNFKVFYPENFGREGLFINIQALFIRQFGHYPWALRLPSAIFGILTVLGLYFFTKELFRWNHVSGIENNGNKKYIHNSLFPIHYSEAVALLASFLLATNFWHINFSRIGFRAIMAPAFLVWSLYLLLKFFNLRSCDDLSIDSNIGLSQDPKKWELGIRNWIMPTIAGLLYGLGFHSYIAYRATPLLILFIFYYFYKNSHTNILEYIGMLFLIFTAAAIIAAAPLGIHFLKNPPDFLGRTAGISIFNSETPFRDLTFNKIKTLGMFNVAGDFNWRHNIAGRPQLFWPVGIFFLIGFYIAIKNAIKISNFQYPISNKSFNFKFPKLEIRNWELVILLTWFLVAFLPVVISNEGLPHALRSILMVPPVFILSAIGGIKIYEFLKPKIKFPLLLTSSVLLLSLLVFESYVSYFITWGQNPNVKPAFAYNDYVISRYLNSLPKETPKYIVVSGYDGKIERDNPISLQSILFLTDTFTDEKRKEKNIFYFTEEQFNNLKPKEGFIIKL